jgi:hypothetical protein
MRSDLATIISVARISICCRRGDHQEAHQRWDRRAAISVAFVAKLMPDHPLSKLISELILVSGLTGNDLISTFPWLGKNEKNFLINHNLSFVSDANIVTSPSVRLRT